MPLRNPKGWSVVELGDLGDIQGGLQLSSRRDELTLKAPYLRVANVYRDRLDLSEIKMIGLTEDELRRLELQPDDLLLVRVTAISKRLADVRCGMVQSQVVCTRTT